MTALRTYRTPPRWAVYAAHAVPLCALPSALWRFAAWLELIPGARAASEKYDAATGTYMLALTVVIEVVALLTLGLVRPWGEVLPQRLPVVGGRAVPRRFVLVAATAGVATLLALPAVGPTLRALGASPPRIGGDGGTLATHGPGFWITAAAYLPLLAWPPLLAVVTWSYARRTRDA